MYGLYGHWGYADVYRLHNPCNRHTDLYRHYSYANRLHNDSNNGHADTYRHHYNPCNRHTDAAKHGLENPQGAENFVKIPGTPLLESSYLFWAALYIFPPFKSFDGFFG